MTTKYKWLPSEPTDKMLKVLRPFLPVFDDEMLAVLYTAVWKAAPEVDQKPIGYVRPDNVEDMLASRVNMPLVLPKPDNFRTIPIYTHPKPKREPLDDETILGIARTIPNLSGDDSALIQFARELGV